MGIFFSALLISIISSCALLFYTARHLGIGAYGGFIVSSIICIVSLLALFFFFKRHKTKPKSVIISCLLVLAPLAIHVYFLSIWSQQLVMAKYGESTLSLDNYEEELVYWEGITEPVGLKISMEINHPKNLEGLIYPPQILSLIHI